jgi:acyl-CoA reductase-like NAD-dependent aldehyde dehydrogenase
MSGIDTKLVDKIVKQVLIELDQQTVTTSSVRASSVPVSGGRNGVFEDVDEAVAACREAQKIWADTSLKSKAAVIESLRATMHNNAEEFAGLALQETGLGRIEDKIAKHHNAADSTPGLEDLTSRSWSGDRGLAVEEYAPYGLIAAITPSTHPIPVMLNSIIILIAPGNGAVFNVHPAAKKVSAVAMEIFNKTIVASGGPPNLVSMIREPTLESAERLCNHPEISLIAATGGPALVELAFRSGKKVVAAGPGNPPVVVDETADLDNAAQQLIDGASFDNNILCIAEKETFVVDAVYEDFMAAMQRAGAVKLSGAQTDDLAQKVFKKDSKGRLTVSRDYVGKNASVLAKAVGLSISDDVRLLYAETGFESPFVQEEQMMPFMPVVRTRSFDEALDLAVKAEHGYGHTAMIHSNCFESITKFCKAINTTIVVVNGSSLAGNGPSAGEAHFSHTIASPTGEGVCTPRDFARIRRVCTFGSLRIV